jgi:putative NADPH-quinone reductase
VACRLDNQVFGYEEDDRMRVLTVDAHPNPNSFCHAVLEQFTAGLKNAGHTSEVIDLYAIKFDPVFSMRDFVQFVDERYTLLKTCSMA